MKQRRLYAVLFASTLVLGACSTTKEADKPKNKPETYQVEEHKEGKVTYEVVTNPKNGATLGYSKDSGLKLIEEKEGQDTYAFKDMNGNGKLDVWEDWRKGTEERAEALAKELSKEEIAGLMLFSDHEREPEKGLTEAQKEYLKENNLRNILNAGGNDVSAAVNWNNEMQAYVESLGKDGRVVIPVNFSSDPRSTAGADAQYNAEGNDISRWPSNLGLAATFDPETMLKFSKASSEEYRAMGIATALGPQIDLATEPRWLRVDGTFGENVTLATDMTRAYVDGSQSSYDKDKDIGWGPQSINAMIKHFPGDGAGEGGRESHMNSGKYAVYPGDNFDEHLEPFLDGGLKLEGKTKQAMSVMSSYSIGVGKDGKPLFGTAKGSAYDKEKIDILREKNKYDGVICTDWGVTLGVNDEGNDEDFGTAWGVEDLSVPERHYQVLAAGVDMFGGNNDKKPVLEAYDMWEKAYEKGELDKSAEERFQESGKRLLSLLIQPGLFENPYLSESESKAIVGSTEKNQDGYQAQLDSVVLLKNKDDVVKKGEVEKDYQDKVVYIPSSIRHEFASAFGEAFDTADPTMDVETAKTYFKEVLTDEPIKGEDEKVTSFKTPDLTKVDMVVVGIQSPNSGGNFSSTGLKEGKFYPLSLQYRPYTADGKEVRKTSIAGDTLPDGSQENRSYFGETSRIGNEYDLDAVLNAKKAVAAIEKETGKRIPVVVVLKAKNPTIVSEFEKEVDAILTGFSVSDQAYFDIILGKQEPKGLLPIQYPQDMATVEAQLEDVGQDMTPYKDSQGNQYDFGYGLNYQGVISDKRTKTYAK